LADDDLLEVLDASEIAILADPKIVLTLVQEEAAQTCRST
jgi:hypothetical protein